MEDLPEEATHIHCNHGPVRFIEEDWAHGCHVELLEDSENGTQKAGDHLHVSYEALEVVDEKGPTFKSYEIETLGDMLAIPHRRIPHFLKDLHYFLQMATKLNMELLELILAKGPDEEMTTQEQMEAIGWDGTLTWIDDGEHEQTAKFLGENGEEVAELAFNPEE